MVTSAPAALTKLERRALTLLARGGARYGTMHATMRALMMRGLAFRHRRHMDNSPGAWTWRPTAAGLRLIQQEGIKP